jgi:MFS family permease
MHTSNQPRRAAAAFVGTTIEFYDLHLRHGGCACARSGVLPSNNPLLSTLAAFGTFAVGFIARPMAGMVFGHLGDRLGRKKCWSPWFSWAWPPQASACYPATPVLASGPHRSDCPANCPGISVGGEWGGAVLMASEHAPAKRKVFYASFAQLGSPAGLLLALIAFRLVSSLEPEEFLSWGWRLPFLASGVLMLVGLAIRFGVEESPEFQAAKKEVVKYPVLEVVRDCWRQILFAASR